jgi:hypothetical protein
LTRSPLEEQQMSAAMSAVGGIEGLRSMVSFDAIKAAATHLRTFGEGRKTLIVITEAFTPISQGRSIGGRSGDRGDSTDPALDLVRTANDSNVAIHVVDPAGLQMGSRPNFFFQTITADTGGELYRTNDLKMPFAKAVMGASAVYLLGYTRDMPGDGRFHQLKVNVKRRGLDVRARAGFWAPSTGEVERARAAAESAALPTPVADAFSSLTPGASPRQVDIFAGIKPLADGRMQVSLAWTRRSSDPRNTPSRVTVTAKAKAVVFDGEVRPDGTTFDTEAANLQLAFTVLSENGDVLDRETRTIDASALSGGGLMFATPVVYRTSTVAQVRAMQESSPAVPIYAGREFVRTDRVFVRVSLAGASSSTAAVTARVLDRRGATLVSLPVARVASEDSWQLELPLGSMGMGEYAVALDAAAGDNRARALVAFRLRQ